MSTPGVSLFQGAESIQVNTSLERAEEEEAFEDQRRRNEELGNLLQNAFDDLDDDESTIDSTTNFQSDILGNQNMPLPNHQLHHQQQLQFMNNAQEYDEEIEKLKILLSSKNHELENIKQMANEEFKKRDELQKRLLITEAELERAIATKNNSHELLVESKQKCSNLENTITKIRNDKKSLESENNTLLGKLETAQTLLADVQRKYDMVERDMNKHSERNAEMRRKQMEDRHRAELEINQEQMDQLINKLDRKTNELENMNTRYHALQSSHEVMLIDKAGKINELNSALNEAQKKCEELLSKPDYFQENVRLQKLLANLQDQIHGQEKTISHLKERLEYTTAELDVMDSVLHQHNLEDTPRRLSQTHGRVVGSTPLATTDRIGNLKEELYRALANLKSKREELRKLQNTLEQKNLEIIEFQKNENKALVDLTTLREEKVRLENRLKIVEDEQSEKGSTDSQLQEVLCEKQKLIQDKEELSKKIDELSMEKHKLQDEYEKLVKHKNEIVNNSEISQKEHTKLKEQFNNVEESLKKLKDEHNALQNTLDQIKKENNSLRMRHTADNIRLELEKHKFLLNDANTECDRLKKLYVEISEEKQNLLYELEKLRCSDNERDLQEQREKIANLQRALQLAEVKATELTKILETEKLCHEREVTNLKEKFDKDKANQMKALAQKEHDKPCSQCLDYMAEITKFEIKNLKLANTNATHNQELDDLRNELRQAQDHIDDLNDKLKLSNEQEHLITELKQKAYQFEQYIKNNSSTSSGNSSTKSPLNKQVNTNEMSSSSKPTEEIKKLENRMREEMAKIFANDLKCMQRQLRETEEKFVCVQHEYEYVHNDLQQRQTEVDVLKQAILAEREKIAEILQLKDAKHKEILKKQSEIVEKLRYDLQDKTKRFTELSKELEERQLQIEAERKSMKAVMSQWEDQQQKIDKIQMTWKEKFDDMKKNNENAIAALETKYNSAKRTAANYKRYAEDKEAHMLREYERIKFEYDASINKIEIRMKDVLDKKNREMKDAMAAMEKNYEMGHEKDNHKTNLLKH